MYTEPPADLVSTRYHFLAKFCLISSNADGWKLPPVRGDYWPEAAPFVSGGGTAAVRNALFPLVERAEFDTNPMPMGTVRSNEIGER